MHEDTVAALSDKATSQTSQEDLANAIGDLQASGRLRGVKTPGRLQSRVLEEGSRRWCWSGPVLWGCADPGVDVLITVWSREGIRYASLPCSVLRSPVSAIYQTAVRGDLAWQMNPASDLT